MRKADRRTARSEGVDGWGTGVDHRGHAEAEIKSLQQLLAGASDVRNTALSYMLDAQTELLRRGDFGDGRRNAGLARGIADLLHQLVTSAEAVPGSAYEQLVAAREAGELTEQRVGQEAAEATIGGLDKAIAQVAPPKAAEAPVTLRIIPLSATAVTVELKLDFASAAEQQPAAAVGATSPSIAAELRRWPRPPASSGCVGDVVEHCWPLYHDHYSWLDEVATTYSFADAGEVLRHLIFVANGETSQVKRLIFKVIRCLHCHSGTRAGHIPKKDKSCGIFDFQMVWLTAVHKQCDHPTVEKTVRVLIDYYRKVTSDKPGMEAELFWRKRTDITRGPQFEAYLPGVPGNYMLNADKVYNKRI